jgi:transcriptional regulator with XRE-family HTH domain
MQEKILQLRKEGKTYSEICELLGCSKSTVNYYCNKKSKTKHQDRMKKLRKDNPLIGRKSNFIHNKSKSKMKAGSEKFNNNKFPLTFHWTDALEKLKEKPFCYLTGEPLDLVSFSNVSFDHIIPKTLGGSNTLDNLGFCIKEANLAKNGLSLEDFFILCKKVLEHNGYSVKKLNEGHKEMESNHSHRDLESLSPALEHVPV